jgi:DNA-binding XRE family transcriptional regulator
MIDDYHAINWKALRALLRWTQYDAAKALGLSRPNVLHMERKSYIPSRAWARLEPLVEAALQLQRTTASDPLRVLPRGHKPEITHHIEVPR